MKLISQSSDSQSTYIKQEPLAKLYTQQPKAYQWSVKTQLPVYYTVIESHNLFAPKNRDILSVGGAQIKQPIRRFIVIDEQVYSFYGESIHKYFQAHSVEYRLLPLPVSEQEKTMDAVFQIVEELNLFGVARRYEPIIAIGGGVLLDIVGLAASLYRRGTPYIRIPTTLLALVDASVGAKTGVNFQMHKNRLGTYYPPVAAFLDKSFLQTLDTRQICNGLAEILKIGIVKDRELFELLEKYGDSLVVSKLQGTGVPDIVIQRAVQGMLEELEPNLWEHKLERLVDFGHSFSPTIEMMALPELLHGEAVAVDMAFSAVLASQRGLLSLVDRDRILNTTKSLKLPTIHSLCETSLLYKALQDTIRHRDGLQRLPLPIGIGSASFFNDVTFEEIETAVSTLNRLSY